MPPCARGLPTNGSDVGSTKQQEPTQQNRETPVQTAQIIMAQHSSDGSGGSCNHVVASSTLAPGSIRQRGSAGGVRRFVALLSARYWAVGLTVFGVRVGPPDTSRGGQRRDQPLAVAVTGSPTAVGGFARWRFDDGDVQHVELESCVVERCVGRADGGVDRRFV